MATTISTTITANGAGTTLKVRKTPRNIQFGVTGPFDGTVSLEMARGGRSNWRRLPGFGPWTRSLKSFITSFASEPEAAYRLRLDEADRSVTNGTFASDTGWTKGTGWTISAGAAASDGSQSAASLLSQTLPGAPLVPGASYIVTFTTTRSAGAVSLNLGGTAGVSRTTAATFTETIVAGATSVLAFSADADFIGTIDTVSITPVISYTLADSDGTIYEDRDADDRVYDTVTEDTRVIKGAVSMPGSLAVAGAVTLTTPPTLGGIEAGHRAVDVTISSAELLALNAAPKTLIAAPGAGFTIIVDDFVLYKEAGTAYAAVAAGEDLSFKYTDASGLEVARSETTGFLDQTTAQTRYVRGYRPASGLSDVAAVTNSPIVAHLLTGEITTGTSPLRVRIYYRVVPTVI